MPNPHRYHFNVNIDQFRSLPKDAFEGHEFIVIKPTEKLSSLEEICHTCLESADDIFEKVPGFGNDQIQPNWALNYSSFHPIAKAIQKHFGWTSPMHAIGTLEGYRHSEDRIVYMLMYDDNFLNQRDLQVSYYGDACFQSARDDNHARGNIVIFKLLIKNKKRMKRDLSAYRFVYFGSDDSDLQHEYELYPITKAEIGHMLQERRKAIEQGKYTRRQWRYKIREAERMIESEGQNTITV